MAKAKNPMFTTPAGIAVYPWLNKPDTQFDADGVYKVDLKMPVEDGQELIAMIDKAIKEQFQAKLKEITKPKDKKALCTKHKPYEMVEDDDGNETGEVLFKFRMNAVVRPKDKEPWEQRPKVFDASRKELKPSPRIFGGSTLKVAFQINPYYAANDKSASVSLRLVAVQIIELVEGGASAEYYGFGQEEGYTGADDKEESSGFEDETTKPTGGEEF